MPTECNTDRLAFQPLGRREVVGAFDGGTITSDAGGLLLREVEQRTGILRQFAACFVDHRDPELVEHTVQELVSQRIYGLALGYEDLNDHDQLRRDPLLATLVGKEDPTGQDRTRTRDRGKPLAGKSTLNRLELTPVRADARSRYKKITADVQGIERLFVELFLQAHPQPPERIVLDFDATDDPVHGNQLGRFFHGYYQEYCFLPLYLFCGDELLGAWLRPADIDGAAGSLKKLMAIVRRIREAWPHVKIVVRGDSGFCREPLMRWCEENNVDYVFGLAKNRRLEAELQGELAQAKQLHQATGHAARVFKDFSYQTLSSWSRLRRVAGKAEHLDKGANPRFVVTSLPAESYDAKTLYEVEYCGRGEMENRIKEQQRFLFADRTSASTMRANQLRLWFSSVAYVLLQTLRREGLQGTPMAQAQCDTIRLKLLKIGAQIRVTVRKVWVALAEGCPYEGVFRQVYQNLLAMRPTWVPCRC
ncbi:MAG: IS1380 family transposase [Hyphomicrobiaceae bacterium]|nr:MAG: IS1380 family transposase [Hyphomicrobiaceae bacterium]